MIKRLLCLAMVCAFAACSGNGQSGTSATSAPAPPLKNTLDFPLYSGASIISSRSFTQRVQVSDTETGSVFSSGSGTYNGTEVIASSGAPFATLSAWVSHLAAAPPSGYASLETGSNPDQRMQARRYGVDYATFTKRQNGKTHGVLVIVMDPQRVNARFGTILSMVAKYRALPAMMRAPIDNEVKARIGMSVSEATAPDSPIGAALAALDQLEHKNTRGIVLLDALKR